MDWKEDQNETFSIPGTFAIHQNEKGGRFLVATRDLEEGELIFKEEPLIVGPSVMSRGYNNNINNNNNSGCENHHEEYEINNFDAQCCQERDDQENSFFNLGKFVVPVCLGCCRTIKSSCLYKCTKCGWPVCSKQCEMVRKRF